MDNFKFDNDFAENDEDGLFSQEDEPFFSQDELTDLMGEQQKIDDAKKIYEKITGILEEKEQNIIKAEDVKENVNDYELEKILNYDNEDRKKDFYIPTANTLSEDITNEELFNDYLKYPKIAGKKSITDDSTLIPLDKIDETSKVIEIKDEELDNEGHHTSIEIVRDEFEEIETIIVHCKCGEKTIIKFDYETNEITEDVITSKTKINPFSVEEIKLKINDEDS